MITISLIFPPFGRPGSILQNFRNAQARKFLLNPSDPATCLSK